MPGPLGGLRGPAPAPSRPVRGPVRAPARGPARPGGLAANPLANPSMPLSGKSLVQAARGLVNAQINPAVSALNQQIGQNSTQTNNALNLTGGYFNQLGQMAQQGVTKQQAIQQQLAQQLADLTGQENGQLQGIGQQAQQNLSSYTPGGVNGAMSGLTAELARQQGLAAQQEGAMRQLGATQGANYASLGASQLGTFGLQGQEDLSKIAQAGQVRNEPLTSKIAALEQQRGSLFATDLGKLRQQEITNNIAQAGLGLKQDALNVSAQNNIRSTNASQANNLRTTQTSAANNLRTTNTSAANNLRTTQTSTANNIRSVDSRQAIAAANLAAKTGSGATKPLAQSQQNTIYRNLDEMTSLIQAANKAGHSEQQIRQALATGSLQKGFGAQPAYLIEAAYELLGYGSIDQSTAAEMHQHGLRGGSFRGKPIKVTQNYNPSNPKQNPPGFNPGQNVINSLKNVFGG